MKSILLLCIASSCIIIPTKSQMLKTTLVTSDTTVTGFLSFMNDTAILLSSNPVKFTKSISNSTPTKFYKYQTMESIAVVKKGTIGKNILIGTFAGIFLGLAKRDDDHNYYSSPVMAGALSGMFCGLIAGLFSYYKIFKIHHQEENFKSMHDRIIKWTHQ
jgi:hypothetical protein